MSTVQNGKGSAPRPIRNRVDFGLRYDAINWPSRHKAQPSPGKAIISGPSATNGGVSMGREPLEIELKFDRF